MALRKMTVALALVAGLGVAATGAIAQTAVATAVKTRHENFKAQGAAFKAINDELKKDAPSMAVITPNALKLKASSTALPTWFPKGSGPESKLETAAKPEVWADAAGFQAAAIRFQGEAAKLSTIATAGDLDGVKAQARMTAGACKNCHDKFRVPKD
jgi:cytochrome c556